jgi:peroxiredoxin
MFRFLPILLLTALLCSCNRNATLGLVGTKAPDITVQDSDRKVSLHDFKGKTVVLNFWATYCVPCIEELPSLMQLQKQMGSRITVVAISEDDSQEKYHAFLKKYNVDLLTVRDPTQESKIIYKTTAVPETFVIDKDGIVRRKFIGAVNWTAPDIVEYFNKM